ncbi:MAG: response regulator [Clostridia bacterium]|nr:response regulator [Clostridia bacterium]
MPTFEEIKDQIRILLVDDDTDYINLAEMYFKTLGYNMDTVSSGEEAINVLKEDRHQIVLLDYFMPGMSGEDVVNEIRKFNQQIIIIMQTGFAGQKPPIETMKKLNIQNYHDKTEGIEKLNLELISAVKIFQQQNAISVAKFRANAVSKLISSIASNIKESLMSVSGTIEITNMMIGEALNEEDANKLSDYYNKNKQGLEKVDKVLTTIITELSDESLEVLPDKDVPEIIESILENELKAKGIKLNTNVSLRTSGYITGPIINVIFVICELILKIAKVTDEKEIQFVFTEDEDNWYLKVSNKDISKVNRNNLYILKNVAVSIKDASLNITDKEAIITLKKNK